MIAILCQDCGELIRVRIDLEKKEDISVHCSSCGSTHKYAHHLLIAQANQIMDD